MTELLPGTSEEYREAVRFYKTVGMLAVNERETAMAVRAVDALRYAALRRTNQRLSVEQLLRENDHSEDKPQPDSRDLIDRGPL